MSGPEFDLRLSGSLCLVTDRSFVGPERFLEVVAAAIDGGVEIVQLRDKSGRSDRAIYEDGRRLRALCADRRALFLVDDRLDLAMALEADGLHLGQTDLPLSAARRLWAGVHLYGVSASSPEEARSALRDGADYIGAGAVFPTTTKRDARSTGLEGLERIVRAVELPVVAIGGIGVANAARIMGTGVAGLAVVSAIWAAADPRAAARELSAIARGEERGAGGLPR